MLNALKRDEVQLLISAGHSQAEVAKLAAVGERSVRRIAREEPVMPSAAMVEEIARPTGRPRIVEPYHAVVAQIVQAEPGLLSVEILRRAKLAGYRGRKSALYQRVASLRPPQPGHSDGAACLRPEPKPALSEKRELTRIAASPRGHCAGSATGAWGKSPAARGEIPQSATSGLREYRDQPSLGLAWLVRVLLVTRRCNIR